MGPRTQPVGLTMKTMASRSRVDRIVDAYRRHIQRAGQEPRMLAAVAFLVTFLATRVITHFLLDVRGGGGIAVGPVHIHHMVFGLVLVLAAGVIDLVGLVPRVCAVLFGVGAALVLDEFALILNLADVYWAPQGRESIDAVVIFAAILLILSLGGTFWAEAWRELTRGERTLARRS
ncbi:MAG TPA: hypothetical protein VGR46_00505 [Candidatus Limnocylindria bacterium]|nr:hypothetical protein [Candidatus Limnocylindria bacterium]